MQDSRINYVIVGAFVTAVLAAFIVVIITLSGRSGATDSYFTVYDNVGGIKYGTIVLYEGYQIGQVKDIQPMPNARQIRFRVALEIEHNWKIPEDSIARSMVSGLLSAVAIDIKAGHSDVSLKPGSEIKGQSSGNIFATLADIGSEFGDLSTNSIKPLLDSLNAYIKQLSDATATHLPEIMANLDKISASVQRSSQVFEKQILSPQNIQNIESLIANADKTAANLAQVSRGLEETRKALSESAQNLNRIIEGNKGNVDESVRNLRYTLDTISRYVDDIAHNADATARNMAEFSRSIRENPGLLIGGAKPDDKTPERAKEQRK